MKARTCARATRRDANPSARTFTGCVIPMWCHERRTEAVMVRGSCKT